jgi:hypothetical protein
MNVDQALMAVYLGLDVYKLVQNDTWVREKIAEIHQNAKTPEEILSGMRALRKEAQAKAKADIEAMTE